MNGEEVQGISQEVTRRVLRAATIEAHGRPGAYVTSDSVMRRAKISEAEELRQIAQYLQSRGWIAEADADYGIFVVTYAGIDEATSE
jgi:RIO-like serine/threonine protein kinase